MSEPFQDFADSDYQRPNLPHTEVPATPIDMGSELPVSRTSLRSKRKMFVLSSLAFSIGSLLILFNSPLKNDFLAPGPLSSVHANILKGTDRCAACHEAGSVSVTQWTQDLFTGGSHLGISQSEKCMDCHDQSFGTEFALNAHNLSQEELADLTATHTSHFQQALFDTGQIFQPPTNEHGELACSACHREHHGMQVSLTELTDQQCQSCHQNVFHSFENDHPEFTSWPQQRRDRIAFDHVSHMAKHFPDKKSEFACTQCHVDDDYQNVKLLVGYEQACAACHDQQVVDSSQKGMRLFALPMVDIDSIANAKRTIGEWPDSATGDFDGPIPPLMRALISANPKASALLNKYGSEFDFADIDPDDLAQVNDAVDLVWHIKELFYELSLSGSSAIESRLEKVSGRSVTADEIAMLTQGIENSVFQEAARRWLPDLNREIPAHRNGTIDQAITWLPTRVDDLFYLVSRDDDQLAPNPLKHLLDAKEGSASHSLKNPGPVVTAEKELMLSEQTFSENPVSVEQPNQPQPNLFVDENHPDVLKANPLRELSRGKASSQPTAGATGSQNPESNAQGNVLQETANRQPATFAPDQDGPDLLLPNPMKTLLGQGVGGSVPEQIPDVAIDSQQHTPAPIPDLPVTRNTVQSEPAVVPVSAKSGWFRDDLSFAITYQPTGHADRFLMAWTDYVTAIPSADERPETRHLFEQLTSPVSGVGQCRKCHSVDQEVGPATEYLFTMNWKAKYRDAALRDFTKFSHGPHMLNTECSSCHALDANSSNVETFTNFDPSLNSSNFQPITKNQCASCHAKGQADNSCTTCHSYHIGTKVRAAAATQLPKN